MYIADALHVADFLAYTYSTIGEGVRKHHPLEYNIIGDFNTDPGNLVISIFADRIF